MHILIAYMPGYNPETGEAFRKLGLTPVLLPEDVAQTGAEGKFWDMDFSDIDAVICCRLFLYNDIARFPKLKYIHTTSAGIDHMPLDYIRAHGITLCNARGVYSVPMAEFALSGVLQLYKAAPLFYGQQKAHVWKNYRELRELGGRQVTLLGAGSIATECARRFAAMGCRCVGLCRHPDPSAEFYADQRSIAELDAVLPETDILLIALPLTDETRGMMDARRFALLKEGAVLVNIARGAIVQTAALADALGGGRLSGAVIDVIDPEPLPADSPLWDAPNLILTPHNSFAGEHNPRRMFEVIYKDTVNWLNGGNK